MGELGIRETHERLKEKLSNYIKAQYFAENDLLLKATEDLLTRKNVLFQEPYIESSESYKIAENGFNDANLPDEIKRYLALLIENNLGVFNTPFYHQVKALEAFYQGKDLFVTTGTGSGKTECFIWPILTEIMREAQYSPETWNIQGIRALILYPMNALVSDQLGRIRNIIGRRDDAYMNILTSIPPLPLAAQIVMKKMVRGIHHLVIITLRRRYTTKHDRVSRRLLFSVQNSILTSVRIIFQAQISGSIRPHANHCFSYSLNV